MADVVLDCTGVPHEWPVAMCMCIYIVCCVNKYICDCGNVSERVKLKRSDYPLVLRIIQGPCEQVCKVFLMEEDLGEEVTYDVNHFGQCLRHAVSHISLPLCAPS